MPAPKWAWDFDPDLFDRLDCLGGMFDDLKSFGGMFDDLKSFKKSFKAHMSAGPGGKGGPWAWGFVGPKGGPGKWGGPGGPWGSWWPGPPGPPRGGKASRGDVRAAILALLQEGPRTGYQVMSDIEERSGGAWRPSPGAVYPALAQLADEGLIVGEESGGRRTFSLTQAGRDYVEQNPEKARGAWESQAQQEAWELPGLFAEAARLGAGIVQIAHAGTPGQVQDAERLLEETRRRLYRILADADADADEDDESEQGDDDGNG
jgi:DNA-binding PadR family transcriptional regulator